ncbi:MAG: hypothetical protein A2Y63_00585 [Candidatus Riflebacteria bacterium RBG_13_59_9]|nr:MAG: hypothetical protein A2Y63_00585 [Candidatus Riflebacteria bacterium RBG_13_59_9]
MTGYLPIAVYLVVLVGFALVLIVLSHLLVPRNAPRSSEWEKPYECGLQSQGLAQGRYPIKYYLVAIMFVIFDLEAVFFYPWALSLEAFKSSNLSWLWFSEMLVFIIILLVGYVYIVAQGVFAWSEDS